MAATRFPFRFAPSYRLPAAAFGVTPWTAYVDVDDEHLHARFGPWLLRTPRANIAGVGITHDYDWLKTAGPAHLSFADQGVTFATNGDRGVCVQLHEPVPAIAPFGFLPHPGVTLTVADCDGLAAMLRG
jgi:hypothetical protein